MHLRDIVPPEEFENMLSVTEISSDEEEAARVEIVGFRTVATGVSNGVKALHPEIDLAAVYATYMTALQQIEMFLARWHFKP